MKRFCPKCGKTIEEEDSINNFCVNCYLEDNDIIHVPIFEITACPKCGILKYARRFFKSEEDLERELKKHIKVDDLDQSKVRVTLNLDYDSNKYSVTVSVKTLIGGQIKILEKEQKVSMRKDLCQVCSRLSGGFFTTILQLRFDTKELEDRLITVKAKEIDRLIETINKQKENLANPVNISKELKQKTGIDLYINDIKHALTIVDHLKKSKSAYGIQKTKTLVGMETTGKRRYRHTICIHFKE